MRLFGLLSTIVLLLATATHAQAQDRGPREHRGFWLSFGLGGGWNASEGLDGNSLAGGTGFLRLGGTPSQQLMVGGEAIGWFREDEGTELARGNTTFSVLYYPSYDGGFYVRGGLGFATLTTRVETVLTSSTTLIEEETENGFGSTLGVGFDIRLARNFYITPSVDWLFQAFGETPSGANTNHILMLSVGATWH